jgi:hypothetical protein
MDETGGLSAFVVVQQVLSERRNVVAYGIQPLREELSFYRETFPSMQRRFTLHRAIPAVTIENNSQQAPALIWRQLYSSAIGSNVKHLTFVVRYLIG